MLNVCIFTPVYSDYSKFTESAQIAMFRKHIFKVLALLAFFAFATEPMYAQSRKKSHSSHSKKKKKTTKKKTEAKKKAETTEEDAAPKSNFTDHLWYGGGVGLGLNSYQNVNTFGIGVSPMVGYKFNSWLSAGPRLSVFFTSVKIPGYQTLGLFDVEGGVFVRAHVFNGFFVQGELSNVWIQQPNDPVGNRFTKETKSRTNKYIGVGYNFGRGQGGVGSEISLHYNFAVGNDINATESPFSYRFGFTWRF
jgi:hypothetical protein